MDSPHFRLQSSASYREAEPSSDVSGEDKLRRSHSESRPPHAPYKESSTALLHHVGYEFHEFVQPKQGCYSDLPAAKISEMMKPNSIDNAPTQTLFSVINGILHESIERKNGEIPQRVACLLRKVIQEIERRILTQAEHIRNQNNLVKARDEKLLSRIRVLETLVAGTSEETQIVANQLQLIKTEKTKIEQIKKLEEQDIVRLTKEKESRDLVISKMKQDLETTKHSYEQHCEHIETKAKETKKELEERIKEVEFHLAESRKNSKELEAFSESKSQTWNSREKTFLNFINLQQKSVQDLRATSKSVKHEVISAQRRWCEESASLGQRLKALNDASQNYHIVLSENRRLYNEVQELKGNIRVYCRIRPFLSGENRQSSTIDYVGENGELLLANPYKQRKDGHRPFKFDKVFGSTATQEDVFLHVQPLIRSVLDGYNVCIFAYGQTGSGKTYTMSGPNSPSKEDWGVNYRALNDLFHQSRSRKNTLTYEVGVQMVEIYNEQVRDLLANAGSQRRLGIWSISLPNGLAVPEASMIPVKSTSDVLELMQIGLANRAVSATALNDRSSRSHSILTVHVRGVDLKTGATLHGSLHLVDLAGSERVDRSEVTGDRLKEAQHINKSLAALGDVIFALSQKSAHVPYRNSKLTQVLQSSLGGQAKTLMLVQINPDLDSYSESLSTLKFAERVSGVELGAAKSNKEGKDVKDLMEQVLSLKDVISRKDEEIEQLQLLKDDASRQLLKDGASRSLQTSKLGSTSLRHSSSSPGMKFLGRNVGSRQHAQILLGEKIRKPNKKGSSDTGNYSDCSDRHSEASSQQSVDDSKQLGENMDQPEVTGAYPETDTSNSSNVESSVFYDHGKLPETRTEKSSNSSNIESGVFHDHGKPPETRTEKRPKVPSRLPRPPLKAGQATSIKAKAVSLKPPGSRNNSTSQMKTSSAKSSKVWN